MIFSWIAPLPRCRRGVLPIEWGIVADNRRTSTRHAVSLQARLVIDGVAEACTIHNMSLGGAMVSVTRRHAMGTRMQLTFNVPTYEQSIEIGATVRWGDHQTAGVQFDGLRAREVWALNEYFKQLSG